MAKVKNITNDVLSLFTPDAPPVEPGDEITVRDERFVGRAWPTSTWELVEAPELDGYTDQSTDEAILWAEPLPDPEVIEGGEVAGPGDQLPYVGDPDGELPEPVDTDPTGDVPAATEED